MNNFAAFIKRISAFSIRLIINPKQWLTLPFLTIKTDHPCSSKKIFFHLKIFIFPFLEWNVLNWNWLFLKLGFTPCKAKQPLQDMELQGSKAQKRLKHTRYRRSLQKGPTVNSCLLMLDLKQFRSEIKGKHSIDILWENSSV